jgi:outer membrane protein assembly factor BamA
MVKRIFSILYVVLALLPLDAALAQTDDSAALCSGSIGEFQFEGNETSRRELLLKLSRLRLGQRFDRQILAAARQHLLDSALYKNVRVSPSAGCAEASTVIIEVEEKYYHLLYPRLKRSGDGDISTGIRYRGSNLFGLDQSLVVGYTQKDLANGEQAESIMFRYELPLVDSPYEYRWEGNREETQLANTATRVLQVEDTLQFFVGRNWVSLNYEQPVLVLASLGRVHTRLAGDRSQTPVEPGFFSSLGLRLEYDGIHEQPYRRYGRFLALDIRRGFDWLGSDFNATVFSLDLRFFHRLNVLDNLNTRLLVSLADTAIFNEPRYEIGGSGTLRGLEDAYKTGNHQWLLNVEYILGLRSHPAWRIALFSDFGNVFTRHDQFHRHGWQATLGAGLRWKIESFVKTDLVIDYGYSTNTGHSKVYVSTSLPF